MLLLALLFSDDSCNPLLGLHHSLIVVNDLVLIDDPVLGLNLVLHPLLLII